MKRGNIKTSNTTTVVGQISPKTTLLANLGSGDHNTLLNKNLPNQHTISAIFGLQEILDTLQQKNNDLVEMLTTLDLSTADDIKSFDKRLIKIEQDLNEQLSDIFSNYKQYENNLSVLDKKIISISSELRNRILIERDNLELILSNLEKSYVSADEKISLELADLQNYVLQIDRNIVDLKNYLNELNKSLELKEEILKNQDEKLEKDLSLLTGLVDVEIRRLDKKDKTLEQQLKDEIYRASSAEENILDKLQQETTRAVDSENFLQENFNTLITQQANVIQQKLALKADLENGKIKETQLPFLNVVCEIE